MWMPWCLMLIVVEGILGHRGGVWANYRKGKFRYETGIQKSKLWFGYSPKWSSSQWDGKSGKFRYNKNMQKDKPKWSSYQYDKSKSSGEKSKKSQESSWSSSQWYGKRGKFGYTKSKQTNRPKWSSYHQYDKSRSSGENSKKSQELSRSNSQWYGKPGKFGYNKSKQTNRPKWLSYHYGNSKSSEEISEKSQEPSRSSVEEIFTDSQESTIYKWHSNPEPTTTPTIITTSAATTATTTTTSAATTATTTTTSDTTTPTTTTDNYCETEERQLPKSTAKCNYTFAGLITVVNRGNAYYHIPDISLTWHQAADYCTNMCGNLTIVPTEEDLAIVTGLILKEGIDELVFLGGNDIACEGHWVWNNEEEIDEHKVGDIQPNEDKNKNCLSVAFEVERCEAPKNCSKIANLRLSATPCNVPGRFICQIIKK